MPKPVNPSRGCVVCPIKGCNETAEVKRTKDHERGPRYVVCPVHGTVRATGARPASALDSWIELNMQGPEVSPENPAPLPDPQGEPEPAPVPALEPAPVPAPKREEGAPIPKEKPPVSAPKRTALGGIADILKSI